MNLKSLNTTGSGNTFRFQNLEERAKFANADISLKKSLQGFLDKEIAPIPEAGDSGCFFLDQLRQCCELNLSADFRSFSDEAYEYAQSLAELLHNKEKVAGVLINHLSLKKQYAIHDVLQLTCVFGRDLQNEVFDFLHEFLRVLISIIDSHDVDEMAHILRTVSFLIKSCMKPVLQELADLSLENMLSAGLSQHYSDAFNRPKHYVRKYAAQAFSIVIRRMDDELIEGHVSDLICNVCGNCQPMDFVDGVAWLLYFSCKSVGENLHSKAFVIIKSVFESIARFANFLHRLASAEGDTLAQYVICHVDCIDAWDWLVSTFIGRVIHGLEQDDVVQSELWNLVVDWCEDVTRQSFVDDDDGGVIKLVVADRCLKVLSELATNFPFQSTSVEFLDRLIEVEKQLLVTPVDASRTRKFVVDGIVTSFDTLSLILQPATMLKTFDRACECIMSNVDLLFSWYQADFDEFREDEASRHSLLSCFRQVLLSFPLELIKSRIIHLVTKFCCSILSIESGSFLNQEAYRLALLIAYKCSSCSIDLSCHLPMTQLVLAVCDRACIAIQSSTIDEIGIEEACVCFRILELSLKCHVSNDRIGKVVLDINRQFLDKVNAMSASQLPISHNCALLLSFWLNFAVCCTGDDGKQELSQAVRIIVKDILVKIAIPFKTSRNVAWNLSESMINESYSTNFDSLSSFSKIIHNQCLPFPSVSLFLSIGTAIELLDISVQDCASNSFVESLANLFNHQSHWVRLGALRLVAAILKKQDGVKDGAMLDTRRKMINIAVQCESTSISLNTERDLSMQLNMFDSLFQDDDCCRDSFCVTLVLKFLFGTIHRKYQTLWQFASQLIITLIGRISHLNDASLSQSVWEMLICEIRVVNHLDSCDNSEKYNYNTEYPLWSVCQPLQVLERLDDGEDMIPQHLSSDVLLRGIFDIMYTEEQSEMYDPMAEISSVAVLGQVALDSRAELVNRYANVWSIMEKLNGMIGNHCCVFIPMMIQFISRQVMSKSMSFEAEELRLEDQLLSFSHSNCKCSASMIADNVEVPKRRLNLLSKHEKSSRLSTYLKIFAASQSMVGSCMSNTVFQISHSLLVYPSNDIAESAFTCLMSFKPSHIVPYRRYLQALFDPKSLKNKLISFSIDKIQAEDRPEVASILCRVLFGRLSSQNKVAGRRKQDRESLRLSILHYLSGLEDYFLEQFVHLMIRPFISSPKTEKIDLREDRNEAVFDYSNFNPANFVRHDTHAVISYYMSNYENIIVEGVSYSCQLGLLNLWNSCVSSMGQSMRQYAKLFLFISSKIIVSAQSMAMTDTEEHEISKDKLDAIRTAGLSTVLETYASYSFLLDEFEMSVLKNTLSALMPSIIQLPGSISGSKKPMPTMLRLLELISTFECAARCIVGFLPCCFERKYIDAMAARYSVENSYDELGNVQTIVPSLLSCLSTQSEDATADHMKGEKAVTDSVYRILSNLSKLTDKRGRNLLRNDLPQLIRHVCQRWKCLDDISFNISISKITHSEIVVLCDILQLCLATDAAKEFSSGDLEDLANILCQVFSVLMAPSVKASQSTVTPVPSPSNPDSRDKAIQILNLLKTILPATMDPLRYVAVLSSFIGPPFLTGSGYKEVTLRYIRCSSQKLGWLEDGRLRWLLISLVSAEEMLKSVHSDGLLQTFIAASSVLVATNQCIWGKSDSDNQIVLFGNENVVHQSNSDENAQYFHGRDIDPIIACYCSLASVATSKNSLNWDSLLPDAVIHDNLGSGPFVPDNFDQNAAALVCGRIETVLMQTLRDCYCDDSVIQRAALSAVENFARLSAGKICDRTSNGHVGVIWSYLVRSVVFKNVCEMLQFSLESLRVAAIRILSFFVRSPLQTVSEFPFMDMSCISNQNSQETDFFFNALHIQVSRREIGFQIFREALESTDGTCPLSHRTLSHILLPMTASCISMYVANPSSMPSGVKSDVIHQQQSGYHNEAIRTTATMCSHLSWSTYLYLLNKAIRIMSTSPRRSDSERISTEFVSSIVTQFRFFEEMKAGVEYLSTQGSYSTRRLLYNYENQTKIKTKLSVLRRGGKPMPQSALQHRHYGYHQQEAEVLNDDEYEACPTQSKSVKLGVGIARTMTQKIMPWLSALMTSTAKSSGDKSSEATERKKSDKDRLIRIPIAIALVKLARLFPDDIFISHVRPVIMNMMIALKSSSDKSRDAARSALCQLAQDLGRSYFHLIIDQLRRQLREGYMIHVRIYSLADILKGVCSFESFAPDCNAPSFIKGVGRKKALKATLASQLTEFDRCASVISQLVMDDILGEAAEYREVNGAQKKQMHERLGEQSFEVLRRYSMLMLFRPSYANLCPAHPESMSALHSLYLPFVYLLQEQESASLLDKIKHVLDSIALGVASNPSVNLFELFSFVLGNLQQYSTDIQITSPTNDSSIIPKYFLRDEKHWDPAEENDSEALDFNMSSRRRVSSEARKKNMEFFKGKVISGWNTLDSSSLESRDLDAGRRHALEERLAEEAKAVKVEDGYLAPKLVSFEKFARQKRNWGGGMLGNPEAVMKSLFALQVCLRCLKSRKAKCELLPTLEADRRAVVSDLTSCLVKSALNSTNISIACHSLRILNLLVSKSSQHWLGGYIANFDFSRQFLAPHLEILSNGVLKKLISAGIVEMQSELVQTCLSTLALLLAGCASNDGSPDEVHAVSEADEDDVLTRKELGLDIVIAVKRSVKHLPIATERLQGLLSLILANLSDTKRKYEVFALIRAVISNTILLPEVYDIVDKLVDLAVASPDKSIRTSASSIVLTFLSSYPLSSEKYQQYLQKTINNISFDVEDGRLSALELCYEVVKSLPLASLEEHGMIILLPLCVRLSNDDSSACRRVCCIAIGCILSRASNSMASKIFSLNLKWASSITMNRGSYIDIDENSFVDSSNLKTSRLGIQIAGLILENRLEYAQKLGIGSSKGFVTEMLEIIRPILQYGVHADAVGSATQENADVLNVNNSTMSVTPKSKEFLWEIIYMSILFVEKGLMLLPSVFNDVCFVQGDDDHSFFDLIVACLTYIGHEWVRKVSARIIAAHFHAVLSRADSSDRADLSSLVLFQPGMLFKIGMKMTKILSLCMSEEKGEIDIVPNDNKLSFLTSHNLAVLCTLLCLNSHLTMNDLSRFLRRRLRHKSKRFSIPATVVSNFQMGDESNASLFYMIGMTLSEGLSRSSMMFQSEGLYFLEVFVDGLIQHRNRINSQFLLQPISDNVDKSCSNDILSLIVVFLLPHVNLLREEEKRRDEVRLGIESGRDTQQQSFEERNRRMIMAERAHALIQRIEDDVIGSEAVLSHMRIATKLDRSKSCFMWIEDQVLSCLLCENGNDETTKRKIEEAVVTRKKKRHGVK